MIAALRVLAVRTVRDSLDDRVPGLAAEMAFYFMLSVPPLLLALVGGVGYVGELFGAEFAESLQRQLLAGAELVFTAETIRQVIAPTLQTLLEEGRADVASFGVVFTLWSASRALNVVLAALTIAYDLESQRRSSWKRRLIAFGVTVGALLAALVVVPVLVGGPRLGLRLSQSLGLPLVVAEAWQIVYWPAVVLLATLVLATLYHFAAPWSTPWRRDLPGAVLGMLAWLAGSAGLRWYTGQTIESEAVYQQISAPLVVLLWLYLLGLAILLGGELNAEIEKLWPTRESVS